MKFKAYRAFINYKKEEDWLNSMAQKGMHMVDYSFCRYLFEEGKPGEYIYRLELLKNLPGHPESAAYLRFMEESGVEVVAAYLRWVYFRKKASQGSFEIYTDREGKIKHARRIITLMAALFILNLGVASYNLGIGLLFGDSGPAFNAYMSIINFTVAVFLLIVMIQQFKLIREQKKDKGIRE